MADTIFKSKVQLRTIGVTSNGSNGNPTTSPTTPSKLMLNHGKPNFTIQRSPKAQENGAEENPFEANKNNNYNPYKKAEIQKNHNNNNILISTKFNGAFKATNVPLTQKQPHQNGNGGGNGNDEVDNEAAKVVLRRPKLASQPPVQAQDGEDENVPEFIRRQRRIQERLAKENILDFENRRSGYFTHMVITPSSPNRQSLVETMTSPKVVPALEMPTPSTPPTSPAPPQQQQQQQQQVMATMLEENVDEVEEKQANAENGHEISNGHTHVEEEKVAEKLQEEVAQKTHEEEAEIVAIEAAIEEVNKAVAGEDDDKSTNEQQNLENAAPIEQQLPITPTWPPIEPPEGFQNQTNDSNVEAATTTAAFTEPAAATAPAQNSHVEVVEVHPVPKENGHNDNDVTISHTNGFDGPSIPAPDPSGALGVNYEPKTVVSFSKDLSSEPNNYPDTVKIVNENGDEPKKPIDDELQEIAKLKFDIKADEQDVQVATVLRTD